MNRVQAAGFMGLVTSMALLLSGCGDNKTSTATGAAPVEKIKIKVGHVVEPTHAYQLGLLRFAELVKEKTKGRAEVTVFPSAQLGGERQQLEALQAGTLEMTLSSTAATVGFVPEWGVFDLPYLFSSYDEMYKVLDGPIGKQFTDLTIKKGIRPLYYWNGGARNAYTSKGPLNTVAAFKGLKIRVIESPTYIATFKALGASPVPMAFAEVYSALEQKVVDGGDNSIPTYYSSRHFEVAKHLTLTQHNFLPAALDISEKFYQSLPKDVQQALHDAAKEAGDYERKLFVEQDQQALQKVKEGGSIVSTITDFAPFREAVKPMWESYTKQVPNGIENLKAIQQTLQGA